MHNSSNPGTGSYPGWHASQRPSIGSKPASQPHTAPIGTLSEGHATVSCAVVPTTVTLPVLEVYVQAHRVTVPVLVGDNFGHNDEASLRSETVYYLDVKLEEARGLAAISPSSHPTHP